MIQPVMDLMGTMTPAQIEELNLDAIEEELRRLKSRFSMLDSLKLANYDDVTISPGTDFTAIPIPIVLAVIPHGLGYVPQFLVYMKFVDPIGASTSYRKLPLVLSGAGGGATLPALQQKVGLTYAAYADESNLYIALEAGFATAIGQPGGGFKFRYFIFSQPNA